MRSATKAPGWKLRWITCGLVLNCLTACAPWETQDVTPEQVLGGEQQPDKLRVILPDRTWVVLRQPTIARDSLFGVVETGMYHGQWLRGGQHTGIPLQSVRQVAVLAEREEGWLGGLFDALAIQGLADGLAECLVGSLFSSWGPP